MGTNENNSKKPVNTCGRIAELVKSAVEECGCTLWDVDIVKEGSDSDKSLVIYIDKPEGISLDDCEMVNDAVDPIIEEADPIEGSYYLEISSPGIERELKTEAHIMAFIGKTAICKLYAPTDGRKQFSAVIKGISEDGKSVIFDENGKEIVLERKAIAQLKSVAEF